MAGVGSEDIASFATWIEIPVFGYGRGVILSELRKATVTCLTKLGWRLVEKPWDREAYNKEGDPITIHHKFYYENPVKNFTNNTKTDDTTIN